MMLPEPYYRDDAVTLYHGDCRELMSLVEADVLVTDPPYGMGYTVCTSRVNGTVVADFRGKPIAGDDSLVARDAILDPWSGPMLVFGTWKQPRPEAIRELLIWNKGNSPGAGDLSLPWGPSHEEIYVLGEGFTGRRSGSVLTYPPLRSRSIAEKRAHPTEKPVTLMADLLSKCPAEWMILDPFAGSGSTLRAAKDLGRKAIGIELEEHYCEIAARRLAQDVLDLGVAA